MHTGLIYSDVSHPKDSKEQFTMIHFDDNFVIGVFDIFLWYFFDEGGHIGRELDKTCRCDVQFTMTSHKLHAPLHSDSTRPMYVSVFIVLAGICFKTVQLDSINIAHHFCCIHNVSLGL